MNEKRAVFVINILKNIIDVYFDTFFVFYFFKVANYEVVPLVKYYITLYFFQGLGFILIRGAIKKNNKVPYFRIGIALQALYIALIMILKENIINYIFLVGLVKGIAGGFYHYPKSIINTEKITNDKRQKFDGLVNVVNKVVAIIIPLILGILLTFFDYVSLGKVFFFLFVIMFLVSFWLQDKEYYHDKKTEFKKFFKLIKNNRNLKSSLLVPLLSGFSYSSGVMGVVITLSKINNFKTNLNLGIVDSLCAGLSLLLVILYTIKIKKDSFGTVMIISGIISFLGVLGYALVPSVFMLIIYLLVRNTTIKIMALISDNTVINLTNSDNLDKNFKPEYYCTRDVLFAVSRVIGYVLLLVVCLLFDIKFINYILIIPALALLIEGFVISKLNKI